MKRYKGIEQPVEGYYILKDFGAVVELQGGNNHDTLFSPGAVSASGQPIKIAKWGVDNLQPQTMLKLVYGNHIKPQLIYTSRDFLLGTDINLYQRILENGKARYEPVENSEMEDWREMVELDKFMRGAAYNLEFFHNYFANVSLSSKTKKVDQLTNFDCTDVRAEVIQNRQRRIENYYIHPDWRNAKSTEVATVAAYDRRDPVRYHEFMYHGRDWLPGQVYYDVPPWWGTKEWTEVSNLIPIFHKNGLKNGYNIKYHIKIPLDYFNQFRTDEEKRAAEKMLMESMNQMLSGVENPEKAFVSKYAVDSTGKAQPGWVIEPIENKMSDDAYSKVNDQANIAHTSGHGIDPSLAGVDTGGKLGGSGSEKRISAQLHIAHRTPNKRKILLELLNGPIRQINGWDRNVVWKFDDTFVTTLEENPKGTQEKKEPKS